MEPVRKAGDILFVRWRDTASLHGWSSKCDVENVKNLMGVSSVGFLVHEDEDTVVLCQSISADLESEYLAIPQGTIIAIRTLRQ